MTVAPTRIEPVVYVRCPDCRRGRHVSARQARRINQGKHSRLCFWCRTTSPHRIRRVSSERYMRWWLTHYGCVVPPGMSVAEYVSLHGVPRELREIATMIWGDEPEQQVA